MDQFVKNWTLTLTEPVFCSFVKWTGFHSCVFVTCNLYFNLKLFPFTWLDNIMGNAVLQARGYVIGVDIKST